MQNEEASTKWLSKIEKKSGVQKTESGLLYKVIEAGDMTVKAADKRDVVKVHTMGRTRTGRVFDATHFADRPEDQQEMLKQQFPDTYNEDKPAEFLLNGVIPGWAEGLQLVGGRQDHAVDPGQPGLRTYGPRCCDRPLTRPLEFEVELADVEPYAGAGSAADSTATAEALLPSLLPQRSSSTAKPDGQGAHPAFLSGGVMKTGPTAVGPVFCRSCRSRIRGPVRLSEGRSSASAAGAAV